MSNIDQTTQMLILVLVCAFVILLVLCFVYFMLKRKERKVEKKNNSETKTESDKEKTTTGNTIGRKSIFDFLDFDKIEVSIDKSNAASIKLFEKMNFKFVSVENELLNYAWQKI